MPLKNRRPASDEIHMRSKRDRGETASFLLLVQLFFSTNERAWNPEGGLGSPRYMVCRDVPVYTRQIKSAQTKQIRSSKKSWEREGGGAAREARKSTENHPCQSSLTVRRIVRLVCRPRNAAVTWYKPSLYPQQHGPLTDGYDFRTRLRAVRPSHRFVQRREDSL